MKSNLKYLQLFEDRVESLKKLHDLGLSDSIDLSESDIEELPAGLTSVRGSLILRDCGQLRSLPEGLRVGGSLYLEGCTELRSLPDGLEVGGSLYLNDCIRLRSLPNGLKVGHSLWLKGSGVFGKPEDMKVGGQIFR